MPFAAKRPCGKPGCANLVSGARYCDDHADHSKQADRWRGSLPPEATRRRKVLEGTIENERLFGLIYMADPEVDWTSRDALVMANPNLGIRNDEESILPDQAEAARNPAKQNIFRCKHLNQWMSSQLCV